jgi:hypothetical protein
MAGFRKAKAEQAALKIGLYGPPGSGKTLTALLCAEGLAKITGKRIAFVDTERGTDFYCNAVPERRVHPDGFDFDAIYTRSIMEASEAVYSLKPETHSVLVIDSITHIWEACQSAYCGKRTKVGTLPIHAWSQIKKPYKDLMNYLLSSPLHVFICGRQGNEFATDEDTEEMKKIGVKMKAEGETPYEPHVLIRMEQVRNSEGGFVLRAIPEKDRSGTLTGRVITLIDEPGFTYRELIQPQLRLLGRTQAKIQSDDEAAAVDAESITDADKARITHSAEVLEEIRATLALCKNREQVEDIGKNRITPQLKSSMTTGDISELREAYLETLAKFPKHSKN